MRAHPWILVLILNQSSSPPPNSYQTPAYPGFLSEAWVHQEGFEVWSRERTGNLAQTQRAQARVAHPSGLASEWGKTDCLESRALSQEARAQAWTLGQETLNARSAPKGRFAAAEKLGPVASPGWFCLLLSSQSLAAPSPVPKDGRAAFPLAAVGRGIPAGAEAAWNHRNDTALGKLGGIPRPRPPTSLVLFHKLGVALSPWALGSWGHTARLQPGAAPPPAPSSPSRLGPPGAERGRNLRTTGIANSTSLPNSRHITPFAGRLQDSAGFGLPTPPTALGRGCHAPFVGAGSKTGPDLVFL